MYYPYTRGDERKADARMKASPTSPENLSTQAQRFLASLYTAEESCLRQERAEARKRAQAWATEVLADPATAILDTETTGLCSPVEFCEIAAIDVTGAVLFDFKMRPATHVTEGAYKTHGYSMTHLRHFPSFTDLYPALREALAGKRILVYNAAFDHGVWEEVLQRRFLEDTTGVWECAMKHYAGYVAEYRRRRLGKASGSFRWQKLPGARHDALSDCRATLALLYEMREGVAPE